MWAEMVYGAAETEPEKQDAPEIPPMFKAEPAVIEAERIVQGCSISRGIPGRVLK